MKLSIDTLLLTPHEQRTRLWLHLVLRSLLWDKTMAPLLEEMGCGWCDGVLCN